jgi:hypothetical protein
MAALMFEKAEMKSKTLHKNVNNPHTTPVVDKAVPDIEGNNDKKDENKTDLENTDNKLDLENTVNKSNTVNSENKLIRTDSTKSENLKNIEKDKNIENSNKNENPDNAEKNENIENSLKKENSENSLKKENSENSESKQESERIKNETESGNSESKQESERTKNETESGNSGDDSIELDKGIQNINLNDRSQIVGLPYSKEGTSRFVGLKDSENQPVNATELRKRIEKLPEIIEAEKSNYIQDKTIEKYNSMTAEEYKIYCENNTTKPPTNPEIPQNKIINVVK